MCNIVYVLFQPKVVQLRESILEPIGKNRVCGVPARVSASSSFFLHKISKGETPHEGIGRARPQWSPLFHDTLQTHTLLPYNHNPWPGPRKTDPTHTRVKFEENPLKFVRVFFPSPPTVIDVPRTTSITIHVLPSINCRGDVSPFPACFLDIWKRFATEFLLIGYFLSTLYKLFWR